MELGSPSEFYPIQSCVLEAALEIAPAERPQYLRAISSRDPILGSRLAGLFSQIDRLGSFLEEPVTAKARRPQLAPGDFIAQRFRILELAGMGGMGEVYRAEDTVSREIVALKTCRFTLWSNSDALARFREEIRIARCLAHPNICRIHDIFSSQEGDRIPLFFTMEWLEGITLAEKLTKGPLPVETALGILTALSSALDAMHGAGIVHRDLKPSNVFLSTDRAGRERPVITDFGLAANWREETGPVDSSTPKTEGGQVMGTPDYMAPEQFLAEPAGPATDVFALGIIAFEMISGHRPYPSGSLIRSIVARFEDPHSTLSTCPELPRHWIRALSRALDKSPSRRYQSGAKFIEDLKRPRNFSVVADLLSHPSRRTALLSGSSLLIPLAVSLPLLRYRKWKGQVSPGILMLTPATYDHPGELAVMAQAADLMLKSQLGQSAEISMLSGDQIERAWRRITGAGNSVKIPKHFEPAMARHIALRAAGQPASVVFSSISETGDERLWRVRVENVTNTPYSPDSSTSKEFPLRSKSDLSDCVFAASRWLRSLVGEPAHEIQEKSRRPEELTTPSWEALKEYVYANDEWRAGHPGPAILHLKAALSADNQFAGAAARLADILLANGQPDDGYQQWARASSLLEKRDLTDRESLLTRGLFALDVALNQTAFDVFSRYELEYPKDPLAKYYKATAVERLDRPAEACLLYSRAIQMDPQNSKFIWARARHYLEQNQLVEAERDWQLTRKLSDGNWTDQLWMGISFAHGDVSSALRAIQRIRATGTGEFRSKSYALEACLRAEQGRWDEAERLLLLGIDFDRANATSRASELDKQHLLAKVLLSQGDPSGAASLCADLAARDSGRRSRLQLACILAQAGDLLAAKHVHLCEATPAESTTPWPVYKYWQHRFDAELALAERRLPTALASIARTPSPPTRHLFPDHALRIATVANDSPLRQRMLTLLFGAPGRWWIEPEKNPPGLLSTVAARARNVPAQISAIVTNLRS